MRTYSCSAENMDVDNILPLIVRWLSQKKDLDKRHAAIFSLQSLTCVKEKFARLWHHNKDKVMKKTSSRHCVKPRDIVH